MSEQVKLTDAELDEFAWLEKHFSGINPQNTTELCQLLARHRMSIEYNLTNLPEEAKQVNNEGRPELGLPAVMLEVYEPIGQKMVAKISYELGMSDNEKKGFIASIAEKVQEEFEMLSERTSLCSGPQTPPRRSEFQ